MANANKVVTKKSELRANKLKSKRAQLENLLRSRERTDYEIKQLKKSIAKDIKAVQHEVTLHEHLGQNPPQEVLAEAVALEEGKDPLEEWKSFTKTLQLSEQEIYLILELLLKFAETL